jgi:hypothetical protein
MIRSGVDIVRALFVTAFGERNRGLAATVLVGVGVLALYAESSVLAAIAVTIAVLLAAGFFVEARPHDPWREYRKRRWDDP